MHACKCHFFYIFSTNPSLMCKQFICWFPKDWLFWNDCVCGSSLTCQLAQWLEFWDCATFFSNLGRWRECLGNLLWKLCLEVIVSSKFNEKLIFSCLALSWRAPLPKCCMFFVLYTHYVFSVSFALFTAPGGQFHLAGQPWSRWSYLPAYRGESDTNTSC